MIQRVQTLLFALAAILGIFLFSVPMAIFEHDYLLFDLFIYGGSSMNAGDTASELFAQVKPMINITAYVLTGLNILVIVFSLVTILKFKKLKSQIKLAKLTIFISVLFIGAIFILVDLVAKKFGVVPIYGLGTWLSIAMLVSLIAAHYFVGKDQKLLRDADRICY